MKYEGYNNLITIGPNKFIVGINLDNTQYVNSTVYNIPNPTNATETHSILQKAVIDIGNLGGGIVTIKQGTYNLIKNLEIYKKYVQINGEGIDTTILKLDDYAPSFIVGTSKRSGFVRARLISNIIISNITLNGNKNMQYHDVDSSYGRYGIFTEGMDNVWFDRVKIINFQGYGFDPHGWKSGGIWSRYLTISNCISERNDWDGFTIDQTFNVTIYNSISNNNGRHGFNIVTGTKYGLLYNNYANYNGFYYYSGSGCGFMVQNNQLYGTSDVTLINNYANNSKKAGFCINDVSNIAISYNNIESSCTCFDVVTGRSTNVTNNRCITNRLAKITTTTVIYGSYDITNQEGVYFTDNIFTKIVTCPK
jgi:hypothetical protein